MLSTAQLRLFRAKPLPPSAPPIPSLKENQSSTSSKKTTALFEEQKANIEKSASQETFTTLFEPSSPLLMDRVEGTLSQHSHLLPIESFPNRDRACTTCAFTFLLHRFYANANIVNSSFIDKVIQDGVAQHEITISSLQEDEHFSQEQKRAFKTHGLTLDEIFTHSSLKDHCNNFQKEEERLLILSKNQDPKKMIKKELIDISEKVEREKVGILIIRGGKSFSVFLQKINADEKSQNLIDFFNSHGKRENRMQRAYMERFSTWDEAIKGLDPITYPYENASTMWGHVKNILEFHVIYLKDSPPS